MTIVDASVWVSVFMRRDAHHSLSRTWIEARIAAADPLTIPDLTLVEVAGAVSRRTGSSLRGVEAVRRTLATPRLTLLAADGATWRLATMIAAGQALRGADAIYVAVARQLNAPLVTWDDEMIKRAGGNLSVSRPVI